jgi:hypothetical protein
LTRAPTSPPPPDSGPASPWWRAPALVLSALVVAATLWPALREPPRDSFPLSSYPMFSAVRGKAWIHVVVGFDAAGNEYKIPPRYVANFEVMQAAETIRRAVRRRGAPQLCEEIAARVAGARRLEQVVRLEVQSRRFDAHTYFVSPRGRVPLKQVRRARCPVPGRSEGES